MVPAPSHITIPDSWSFWESIKRALHEPCVVNDEGRIPCLCRPLVSQGRSRTATCEVLRLDATFPSNAKVLVAEGGARPPPRALELSLTVQHVGWQSRFERSTWLRLLSLHAESTVANGPLAYGGPLGEIM